MVDTTTVCQGIHLGGGDEEREDGGRDKERGVCLVGERRMGGQLKTTVKIFRFAHQFAPYLILLRLRHFLLSPCPPFSSPYWRVGGG